MSLVMHPEFMMLYHSLLIHHAHPNICRLKGNKSVCTFWPGHSSLLNLSWGNCPTALNTKKQIKTLCKMMHIVAFSVIEKNGHHLNAQYFLKLEGINLIELLCRHFSHNDCRNLGDNW